jgi:hypothetical protein
MMLASNPKWDKDDLRSRLNSAELGMIPLEADVFQVAPEGAASRRHRELASKYLDGLYGRGSSMQLEADADAARISIWHFTGDVIRALSRRPNDLHMLTPRQFEQLVATLIEDMGAKVELTPESKDKGRDILAAFDTPFGELLALVECKKYRADRPVGIDIVKQFLWTVDRQDNASFGLVATTSTFTRGALEEASKHKWRLKLRDLEHITEWLKKFGTWQQSAEHGLWTSNVKLQ